MTGKGLDIEKLRVALRRMSRGNLLVVAALLRRIDKSPDDVIFFADEAGSWQVGVDWRAALPAYFRCLADGTSAEAFASEVDRTITDFANYERPRHLGAARRVANAGQKAALRSLPARRERP